MAYPRSYKPKLQAPQRAVKSNFSVNTISKILLYLGLVLFTGALIAPLLFTLGHSSGIVFLQNVDFHRYFDRSLLIAAIALFWPIARTLRTSSNREAQIPLKTRGSAVYYLGVGFAVACLSLWTLGAIGIAAHVYSFKPEFTPALILHTLTQAAIAATGASVFEELLFRKALLGIVQKTTSKLFALVFVSVLFAIVHFLKPPAAHLTESDVHWFSGFVVLPQIFCQFSQPLLVAAGFTTLFGVGLILGHARQTTHSLFPCIGLHAGWIFGLKTFSGFTRHAHAGFPWFGENLLIGFAPLCVLFLTGFFVYHWLRKSVAGNKTECTVPSHSLHSSKL